MTNKVRELGVSSIEEMFDLATYAFNGADTPERRERFVHLRRILGITDFLMRRIG